MASRTSWIFAKGAVVLIVGGFASLGWRDAANSAYAAITTAFGHAQPELFPIWGSIATICAGFVLAYIAYKTR